MNILAILLPPVLGGIIALSTNWIAIKMLFRPHKEVKLFGFALPFTPGVIPKERGRLAKKLGEAISSHLLTPDILASKLADPSIWPLPDCTVGELLKQHGIPDPGAYLQSTLADPTKKAADFLLPKVIDSVTNFPDNFPTLDKKLSELIAQITDKSISRLAGLFVKREKIYDNIKESMFEYLTATDNYEPMRDAIHSAIDNLLGMLTQDTQDSIPKQRQQSPEATKILGLSDYICNLHIRDAAQVLFQKEPYASTIRRMLETAAAYMATHMPIADMIEQKMSNIDIAETEKIILAVVGRELKLIIWLGGVFGFLIGLLSLALQVV